MTWRLMEDGGVAYQESLVARSYKRCSEICKRMKFVSKNEE